jgi:hypothetical protein
MLGHLPRGSPHSLAPTADHQFLVTVHSLSLALSTKERDFSMSSTPAVQATSSTFNVQLIVDALADYAKITGIDLSNNPFASALEQSNSPEAVLEQLQEREKAFKEYRDGNRRLMSCLSPVVKVLQAFSGILGDAVSLVGHLFHLVNLLM